MKIGIVTFYWSNNLGALIQSYCLNKFLKSLNKNFLVNFNRYQPKKLLMREHLSQLKTYNPIKYFMGLKKNKSLENWKINEGFSIPKTFDFSHELNDLTVYGSDEIWNFTNPFFGYDPYFFGAKDNSVKIAYAASFGSAESYKSRYTNQISENLKKFKHLSVRDEVSQKYIKYLTGRKAKIVCDPSLLINFNKKKKIKTKYAQQKNYILVYGTYFSKINIKEIRQISKKNKFEIISVSYYNIWADKNILDCDPYEFISLIKKSQLIFTSMFHGVMLSYKYKKNFWYIKDPYRKNKLQFFLNKFNLNNRCIDTYDQKKINYALMKNKYFDWIEFSKSYLFECFKKYY